MIAAGEHFIDPTSVFKTFSCRPLVANALATGDSAVAKLTPHRRNRWRHLVAPFNEAINALRFYHWEHFRGIAKYAPASSSWGQRRVDLFVTGNDNALYHKWWNGKWRPSAPSAGPWERFEGFAKSAPAVTSWGNGRIDLFVTGRDCAIYHKWYHGKWNPSPPSKAKWERFEPPPGGVVHGPAVASWGKGRLDLFVTGVDGAIYHKWFIKGRGWLPSSQGDSKWERFEGYSKYGPAVASWGDGRLDLFVTGKDDAIYHKWFDRRWYPARPASGKWERFAGVSKNAPAVASWSPGRVDLFVKGSDDAMYHKWFDNGWHPTRPKQSKWERIEADIDQGLSVSSRGHRQLDVFAIGQGDDINHTWYKNGWRP